MATTVIDTREIDTRTTGTAHTETPTAVRSRPRVVGIADARTTHDTETAERQPTARQLIRPFWYFGALLMMLDGMTTYIALEFFAHDGAREGNPLAVWVIDHIGVAGMCTVKVLIGVTMMWRLAVTADRGHRHEWMNRGLTLRKRPRWKVQRNAAWALAFSVALMGVVVGNNLRAIVTLWTQ